MGCGCGKPKHDDHCGVSPAVLQINNPSECVLFHRVEVPASMGDSKTNPPKSGAYKNVLLYYEADQTSWLYSSDGIPQKLVNGITNYEDAINLPQINGVTLLGNKSLGDLGITDAIDDAVAAEKAKREAADEALGDEIDIINDELLSRAVVFDTVADMKASTDLKNGMAARTLGFHTINDGGGALYKITNTGTANEMDIIAIDTMRAHLITDNEINVKQLGAYGDNIHDDSSVFARSITLAQNYDSVLFMPKSTYFLDSQIEAKHIVIKCEGELNNTYTLVLGANSNGSTHTDVNIYKCKDVKIEGAKNCYFNIINSAVITLYADGSDASNTSIAYNVIDGIICSGITINGINNGWINENKFNIKRCNGDLVIGGDGTYSHNNNHFDDICIEGDTKNITINYGHCNYITYRGEHNPIINLNTGSPMLCFGNIIQRQLVDVPLEFFSENDINKNVTFNINAKEYIPNYRIERLLDLNLDNAKNIDGQIWINSDGVIHPGWNTEYESEKLDASYPFILYLNSDQTSHRVYITCFDSLDNQIEGNVYIPGVTYNTTNQDYRTTVNKQKVTVAFAPSSAVKYIKVKVTGGNTTFSRLTLDMILPFTNTNTFINTISTDKKHLNNIPSSFTANNPTWKVGDVVYNTSPTAGGVFAWVCTTAGTGSASVWKAISVES